MQAQLISLSSARLNYVIQEYTGTSGCFTSPLLYGTALNIAEGRQSVPYIQTLNNIGEVNNPHMRRSCHKAEGVDLLKCET